MLRAKFVWIRNKKINIISGHKIKLYLTPVFSKKKLKIRQPFLFDRLECFGSIYLFSQGEAGWKWGLVDHFIISKLWRFVYVRRSFSSSCLIWNSWRLHTVIGAHMVRVTAGHMNFQWSCLQWKFFNNKWQRF